MKQSAGAAMIKPSTIRIAKRFLKTKDADSLSCQHDPPPPTICGSKVRCDVTKLDDQTWGQRLRNGNGSCEVILDVNLSAEIFITIGFAVAAITFVVM